MDAESFITLGLWYVLQNGMGHVFNIKLGRFISKLHPQTAYLELNTRPNPSPVSKKFARIAIINKNVLICVTTLAQVYNDYKNLFAHCQINIA